MKLNRKIGLLLFIASLAMMMLACGLTGSSEPTQAPQPVEPTAVPVEATEAPTAEPEPTEIPTEAPAEEPTPEAPVGDPSPPMENALVIEAVHGYRDELGSLHIVGLITNHTDRAVDSIEIEIEILDEGENSLYVETVSASLYTVAPGETTPFSFWV